VPLRVLSASGGSLEHTVVTRCEIGTKPVLWEYSAAAGRAAAVRALILDGAKLDTTTHDGGTALMAACESNHQTAARTLILAGANVDLQMNGGASALMLACLNGHEEVSQILLQAGAKVHGAALTGDALQFLPESDKQLLENLIKLSFPGCTKVQMLLLRKSSNGGLLLQTQSFDNQGKPQMPTVTRLDLEVVLREEISGLAETIPNLGASGTAIMRGPIYLDCYGACVLQMSGACWALPDFEASKVITFASELRLATKVLDDHLDVLAQLWGTGGGLRSLASATAQRVELPTDDASIELLVSKGPLLQQLVKAASHVLLPARDNERWNA
jgi:hypothetical protein